MKKNMKSYISRYKNKPFSLLIGLLTLFAAVLTFGILFYVIGFILVNGVPHLKPSLFEFEYNSENVSLLPALFNTLIITVISLLIAVPIGVSSAVYLVEYANRGNKFVKIVRITAETLSGIPSIVYGLFGMLFFVTTLNWKMSIASGSFTLAIMILPLIMRTTEEALMAVPDTFREGSFGLGAGRLRTVGKVVLPAAIPGILSGVILGVGRIVGETAALIYTAGTVADIAKNLNASGRTLAVHMWALSGEGLYTNQAFATAVVLLIIVIIINATSNFIARGLNKNSKY